MEIKKLKYKDLATRVNWMNNPKVYKNMHFQVPVTIENTLRWFENIQNNVNRLDFAFWENQELVAMGGLTGLDGDTLKAELYIFVNPTIQLKGIGTQATRLLCDYGFSNMGLNKIFLITNEDNIAAQKVYEKCGFVKEGQLRNEYKTSEGIFMDRIYYGLLKSEWNANN